MESQTKATIYKHFISEAHQVSEKGVGYSMRPWGDDTAYYKGSDDGGRQYLLPAGYSVGRTQDGARAIFDAQDRYIDLGMSDNGLPTVVDYDTAAEIELVIT